IAIGATRLAIGGLFLLCIGLLVGRLDIRKWPVKTTILASLSMSLYQPLFFSAVSMTGVAIGTVVAIGSAPVFSGFIEWVYDKKRPSMVWWLSTFLAILGCILLMVNKGTVYMTSTGLMLALGAGLSFASYTRVSRGLVEQFSSISVVAVVFTLSALFYLHYYLFLICHGSQVFMV